MKILTGFQRFIRFKTLSYIDYIGTYIGFLSIHPFYPISQTLSIINIDLVE